MDENTPGEPPDGPGQLKQVFFHVGAPKTGTTYIQQVLWHNRRRLAKNGMCYPLDHPTAHFTATLDLCQRKWGGRWDPSWDGSWERVANRIQEWEGDRAIFSGELMGLATTAQARLAVESVQPAEVHVVFTARDFARQLPSDWQEQIKHRHTVTLTKFVDDLVVLGPKAPRPFGELFWGLHDAAHVLAKWEGIVPIENIHVVTVPQSSARADLLWRRFSTLCGLDPDAYDLDVPRDNTAMGVVETEFLRRFNATSGKALTHEHGPLINNLVGQRLLANRAGKQPIRMPRQYNDWIAERSSRLIAQIRGSGYDVRGDLGELQPALPPADEPVIVPEELANDDIEPVALDLVAGLIDEVLSLRGQVKNLTAQLRPKGQVAKKAAAKKAAAEKAVQAAQQPGGPRGRGAAAKAGGSRTAAAKTPGRPSASARATRPPERRAQTDDEA